jgi:hypothetical protein
LNQKAGLQPPGIAWHLLVPWQVLKKLGYQIHQQVRSMELSFATTDEDIPSSIIIVNDI